MSTEDVQTTSGQTTTSGQATSGQTMSDGSQRDFATEVGKLRASNNSGPMDQRVSLLGVILAIIGLATILVCFLQSRGYSDPRDQTDSLILSVFALGLIVFGSTLYIRSSMTRFLRYWLLRMVYEQRDLARSASTYDGVQVKD
jgi:hypothetical protein